MEKEKEYAQAYRESHREYYRDYATKYQKEHKEHCNEYQRKYRLKNKKKLKVYKKVYHEQTYQSSKRPDAEIKCKQPGYSMWCRANKRSKKSGVPFTITVWDIVIPTHCPYLGIPLTKGSLDENWPSLDRIDNDKGYVPGNIRVISKKANTMKNNASIERLRLFAKNVLKLHPIP